MARYRKPRLSGSGGRDGNEKKQTKKSPGLNKSTSGRARDAIDRTKLPLPEPKFHGKIGKTYVDSKEDWPKVPTPPKGAPNVVIILLEDVGFGQVSTFGGPVPTPELEL